MQLLALTIYLGEYLTSNGGWDQVVLSLYCNANQPRLTSYSRRVTIIQPDKSRLFNNNNKWRYKMKVSDAEIIASLDSDEATNIHDVELILRTAQDFNFDVKAMLMRWQPFITYSSSSLDLPAGIDLATFNQAISNIFIREYFAEIFITVVEYHKLNIPLEVTLRVIHAIEEISMVNVQDSIEEYIFDCINSAESHTDVGAPTLDQEINDYTAELRSRVDEIRHGHIRSSSSSFPMYYNTIAKRTLSAETISFLAANGFSTKPEDLDKCTSDKHKYYTPLTFAAKILDHSVFSCLLLDGVDINAKNGVGNTAMHILADVAPSMNPKEAIHASMTVLLLDHNANSSIKNNNNKTAVDIARSKNNLLVNVFSMYANKPANTAANAKPSFT